MNKKYIYSFVALLAIGLVSAGVISYYGQVSQEITIDSPLTFTGDDTASLTGYLQSPVFGEKNTVKNNAPFDVDVKISNSAWEVGVGDSDLITTSYVGELELTKKTVNFALDEWAVLSDKVQIEYIIAGEEFNAEVITDAQNSVDYVLVYYADNDVRFANPGQAVLVEDVSENLPGVDDENADLNDYSAEYLTTPFGAKIWYVPSDAIPGGVIDWSRASEFYFESSLIQYNDLGQITVYPGETLDFTPEFNVSLGFVGNADITTSVAPVM